MSEEEYNFKDHLDKLRPGYIYDVTLHFDIDSRSSRDETFEKVEFIGTVPHTYLLVFKNEKGNEFNLHP
jgi:hypothetical protein